MTELDKVLILLNKIGFNEDKDYKMLFNFLKASSNFPYNQDMSIYLYIATDFNKNINFIEMNINFINVFGEAIPEIFIEINSSMGNIYDLLVDKLICWDVYKNPNTLTFELEEMSKIQYLKPNLKDMYINIINKSLN